MFLTYTAPTFIEKLLATERERTESLQAARISADSSLEVFVFTHGLS